jgi:DNA repair exonuclease SbcCD ATPase subunit
MSLPPSPEREETPTGRTRALIKETAEQVWHRRFEDKAWSVLGKIIMVALPMMVGWLYSYQSAKLEELRNATRRLDLIEMRLSDLTSKSLQLQDYIDRDLYPRREADTAIQSLQQRLEAISRRLEAATEVRIKPR